MINSKMIKMKKNKNKKVKEKQKVKTKPKKEKVKKVKVKTDYYACRVCKTLTEHKYFFSTSIKKDDRITTLEAWMCLNCKNIKTISKTKMLKI